MKKLMGYDDVAEHLGVSVSTLYAWVGAGRIPCVYLGPRCVKFDPDAIDAWIDAHRRAPAAHVDAPTAEVAP